MTNAIMTALKVFTLVLIASIVYIGSPASAQTDQESLAYHELLKGEAQTNIDTTKRARETYIADPNSRFSRNYDQRLEAFSRQIAHSEREHAFHVRKASEYRLKIAGYGKPPRVKGSGILRPIAPVALAAGALGAGLFASSKAKASEVRISSDEGAPQAVRLSGSNVGDQSDLSEEAASAPASTFTNSSGRQARTSR
jgi:hypothetical protein